MAVSNTVSYVAHAGRITIGGMGEFGSAKELSGGDPSRRNPVVGAVAQEFVVRQGETATISGASKANPGVITATSHGLLDGDIVSISGVVGMVELNGNQYSITTIQTNDFVIQTVPKPGVPAEDIDTSSGFTTYTSAGTATLQGIAGSVTISLP